MRNKTMKCPISKRNKPSACRCDMCGKTGRNLNQMEGWPGVREPWGDYRAPWICGPCLKKWE